MLIYSRRRNSWPCWNIRRNHSLYPISLHVVPILFCQQKGESYSFRIALSGNHVIRLERAKKPFQKDTARSFQTMPSYIILFCILLSQENYNNSLIYNGGNGKLALGHILASHSLAGTWQHPATIAWHPSGDYMSAWTFLLPQRTWPRSTATIGVTYDSDTCVEWKYQRISLDGFSSP